MWVWCLWCLCCWHVSGPHSIEVCYDDSPVPNSPFSVTVTEGCDPGRVQVQGPGLMGGVTNKPNRFKVVPRSKTTIPLRMLFILTWFWFDFGYFCVSVKTRRKWGGSFTSASVAPDCVTGSICKLWEATVWPHETRFKVETWYVTPMDTFDVPQL